MAFEPQRFLHAANIRLDVPVSVQTAEALSKDLRFDFEDATLRSFATLIDHCVTLRVDFLLLSGNVFVESDRSLRARLALLKGFRTLAEAGIPVLVIAGDTDPVEAWRAIPDLPENVQVCLSSSPEPIQLSSGDRVRTTLSSSIWFGRADDFGIRVLPKSVDHTEPLRIGVISRASFAEARRMSAAVAGVTDDALATALQQSASGEVLESGESTAPESHLDSVRVRVPLDDTLPPAARRTTSSNRDSDDRTDESGSESGAALSYDAHFLAYADELLREGRFRYLVLMGETGRVTLWRDAGVVHCPGKTQPCSRAEAAGGACSLVEFSATGEVRIRPLDTSSVDWKQAELFVDRRCDLSTMLQLMKTRLLELPAGSSDQIWSVEWTVRGPLSVLQELSGQDLETAAAVELDEIPYGGGHGQASRVIRLLHEIRYLPEPRRLGSPPDSLADQFELLITERRLLSKATLQALIAGDARLSAGWKQRLTTLLPALDAEQIVARLRQDGAAWFAGGESEEIANPETADTALLGESANEWMQTFPEATGEASYDPDDTPGENDNERVDPGQLDDTDED